MASSAPAGARAASDGADRRIAIWLFVCGAMIFAMVVIGGVTRLTQSGLSMVEWKPLLGIMPPLGDGEWQQLFRDYQRYPEYWVLNTGMTLDDFKLIFWFEYTHRLWGRLIGLVFLVPFLYFLVRGRIGKRLGLHLGIIFALGVLQGLLGWYMVKSGLVKDPTVSQYRLAAHLAAAFAIYAYILWIALGLLAGMVALVFMRTLYAAEDLFDRVPIFPPIRTLIGGGMIGIIGVWLPQVFGVGYETINDALQGAMVWKFMLLLVVFKIVAVSITIGSGGSGGIFAPSLFIGAMLGGAVGTVVHTIWPASTAGAGAYALVGMGAVVAAGTHAPITAILIIFELTGDYKIILPLMISCITATLLANQMQTASIYTLKLLRRGIDIHKGKDVNVLQSVHVREEMRSDVVRVSPEAPLVALLSKFIEHPGSTLFVTDDDNHLLGIVTSDDIRPLIRDAASLETLVIAEDVMTAQDFPTVSPDDSLAHVMKCLGSYRGEVAVLQRGQLVGVIWPEDVIQRYNTEIFKRDMARSMVSAVNGESAVATAVEDTAVTEIPVPAQFIGRSIRDLDIRKNFGVSVLMVKQSTAGGQEKLQTTPSADYTFRQDDVMLVMGPNEELRRLKRGG